MAASEARGHFVYTRGMQIKEDSSYGVVPVYFDGTGWKVLVIHQISYRGSNDTFWIFPKGHAEGNETPEISAKRELLEETGVEECILETEQTFTMTYSFRHEGVLINKTVTYFIGYCKNQGTKITQPAEVKELKWVSFEEAERLLAHQNSKDILNSVIAFLNIKDKAV